MSKEETTMSYGLNFQGNKCVICQDSSGIGYEGDEHTDMLFKLKAVVEYKNKIKQIKNSMDQYYESLRVSMRQHNIDLLN